MTDLERRAILGDAEAQRECTEKGIVLRCPKCGAGSEKIRYSVDDLFICEECGISQSSSFRAYNWALEDWNTRAAPPIGRCGECAAYVDNKCMNTGYYKPETGFCDDFEPKGGEENAVD